MDRWTDDFRKPAQVLAIAILGTATGRDDADGVMKHEVRAGRLATSTFWFTECHGRESFDPVSQPKILFYALFVWTYQ
jgi:hypothetical protein